MGGALGVAVVSSAAASYTVGSELLVALTKGFRAAAFGAAVVFALLGLLAALALLTNVGR